METPEEIKSKFSERGNPDDEAKNENLRRVQGPTNH
jgi:hypothetical protein